MTQAQADAMRIRQWQEWLTDERLSRWNHYRFRAGLPDITQEQGAAILANVKPQDLAEIKGRIE